MKQKRKALLGLAVLLCAAALLAGIYLTFRPQTVEGAKTVTVEVIAGGETVQTHTIQTDAEYLRGALEQEKMVGGEESAYGLFLLTESPPMTPNRSGGASPRRADRWTRALTPRRSPTAITSS